MCWGRPWHLLFPSLAHPGAFCPAHPGSPCVLGFTQTTRHRPLWARCPGSPQDPPPHLICCPQEPPRQLTSDLVTLFPRGSHPTSRNVQTGRTFIQEVWLSPPTPPHTRLEGLQLHEKLRRPRFGKDDVGPQLPWGSLTGSRVRPPPRCPPAGPLPPGASLEPLSHVQALPGCEVASCT